MADLNQMTARLRTGLGLEIYQKIVLFLISEHENTGEGPICCFFLCKSKDISKKVLSRSFKNYANSDEDLVIGCSRGCLPIRDTTLDAPEVLRLRKHYAKKLCRECVEEAREVIKKDGSKT